MDAVRLAWDEAFLGYDFGPTHPMAPIRLDLTRRLLTDLGLVPSPGIVLAGVEPAPDDLLAQIHDRDYIAAVRAASQDPDVVDLRHGLGGTDNPTFRGMHEASARLAAATRDVALAVWNGEAAHGVNFAGGMHHAMPAAASGFCVYNDVALGIRAMLDAGAERVAYVDVDVHHGDGVERMFWDDPRVLTISLHETGRVLFPGTGFPDDIGGPGALGSAVNVALPPGTSDAAWLRAFHAVVPPLLREFEPQVLVSQHGCDTHFLDPLAAMALSLDAQRMSYEALHDLAHEFCDGRWVAVGGGGYEVIDVVPRAWSHLVAIAAHAPVAPTSAVPPAWREYTSARCGRSGPARMTDGLEPEFKPWATGSDPGDVIDRAISLTRRAVFPLHGLDPWFD